MIKLKIEEQNERMFNLARLLHRSKINSNINSLWDFSYFIAVFNIVLNILFLIQAYIINFSNLFMNIALFFTLTLCLSYLVSVISLSKLKTLMDYARQSNYEGIPEAIKEKIEIDYIRDNNVVDLESVIMNNIGKGMDNVNREFYKMAKQSRYKLSLEDKKKAFIYFVEDSYNFLKKYVFIFSAIIITISLILLISIM
jgi:hypothetical protein